MKKLVIVALVCLQSFYGISQNTNPCSTDQQLEESLKQDPELKLEQDKATLIGAATPDLRKKGTVRYIPVVFHVIHKYGFENITQGQLNDALRVMNEDFRKLAGTNGGSSTDPLATDMEYEFRLAQFDANGQLTNGVNRIYNLGTDDASDAQKSLSVWNSKKYFNIWVVNTIKNNTGQTGSIVLGYAQFPFQINSQGSTDGVMARADQMGAIDAADGSQAGRTLTHESGHWVGLYHPFQGGCVGGSASNCTTQGDQVCDTPPVSTATTGCPSSRNSCTNDVPNLPDLIKNYMDYADGTCMNMYTPGQKSRADQMMAAYRSEIYSSANLSAAGLNTNGSYRTLTASTTKAPYSFSFSTPSLSGTGWTLENYMSPGDSGWHVNTSVGAGGNGCLSANNLNNSRNNVRNAFVSPSIDISVLNQPSLNFYLAYAKRISVSGDRIKVYISNSHGRSETLVRTILSTEMETGALSTSPFVPTSSEWKRFTIDLSPYKSYTNCKIRIELQSLRGNNIYFDEFSISEPTGISERLKQEMNFNLFPNPSKDLTQISFTNPTAQEITIDIIDLQGKKLKEIGNGEFAAGSHELKFGVKELNSGIYLIEVKTESGVFVHKLWVE
ncbi:MAG: T9SS type A sorting domain-containing protein [Bacteroidia bacterium]|nr:T9SS type A sorting domain-containing protein [Bacteroidia bacterium]MCF8447118.1 T9SS type A sorting domain-containing protein [Bacteroidia bacterium]